MTINTKLPLLLLLFFVVALSACLALATQEPEVDPELKTCKHQCQQQQQYSERDKQKCMRSCEDYHRMKKERERQIEEEIRRRKEREMEGKGGDGDGDRLQEESEEEEEEEQKEEREEGYPFFFGDDQFESRYETEDGRFWVLQKFSERCKLFRGIENFRLAIFEANQHTFAPPCHFDSELILFDVKGRGAIGMVKEDKTERFNLEPGDIMRIPAGTPVYAVNRDENEKLLLAQLHIPVSIPGKFEAFYGPGGRDPESVVGTFSWEVLEAAFKNRREKLEKLFERQKKGSIFKISKEQVHALSREREGPSIWPFGSQSRGPFNLLRKRPSIANDYGVMHEVGPDDQRDLENLNLMITFANITNGSMTAPLYYSKATKIAMVTEGTGRLEIVTPYMSRGESKKSSPTYERVSAHLRPGVVFVVPSGHPFVIVASDKQNLQILCFEVNARGNRKFNFAGKRNIVSAMDKNAKELAFNFPAEKVDQIFEREEQFFFPGPENHREREEGGRAYA